MELFIRIIAIALVALIVVYTIAISLPDKDEEDLEKESYEEVPVIGDFGIDPEDIPVAEKTVIKPKRKYKKRNKKSNE